MDSRLYFVLLIAMSVMLPAFPAIGAEPTAQGQSSSSSSSSSPRHAQKTAATRPDAGSVSNGVYRNWGFGFACKIPAGWVLRTEEMNEQADGDEAPAKEGRAPLDRTAAGRCPNKRGCGRVLLAAFSRPPEARGEDVNSSILIVAENVDAYPGLKEAAQYLGPVTEIAHAQGFEVINEPYEFVVGTKTLARSDFQKDVETRVMWQSTLVVLARGYALSFTFIGGNEDEAEELVEKLSFAVEAKPRPH
ncbi:MAG: hypothetical protein WBX08_15450 [Candidatus Sulfotelmatobacter sp.]